MYLHDFGLVGGVELSSNALNYEPFLTGLRPLREMSIKWPFITGYDEVAF